MTTILDSSSLARALYSTDASIYRVVPDKVAYPKTVDELIEITRTALTQGIPITARGAGTSCAGNAVGSGLVIDLRRLNRIIEIDAQNQTAVIEPGVIQSDLQAACLPYGLRFGPDPSTSNRCTIGGMIGNNACGPRALGYGRTSDNIVELEILMADGQLIQLSKGDKNSSLAKQLDQLVHSNLGVIRTQFGTFSRQVSGYSLEHLLPENGFDLPSFFVGSEGTLGLVTKAKVRLVRDLPAKLTIALGYPTMADAADAMANLLKFKPTACEGMDRRLLDAVRDRVQNIPALPAGDGWMFLELVGDDPVELKTRADDLVNASQALEGWVFTDPAESAPLWSIRTDAAGLAGVVLDDPAYPGWEDAAVPPQKLGNYLREFDELLAEYGIHGYPYGHFGDGCVHCRIDFPLTADDGPARYASFVKAAAKLVAKYGGSVSGEHGDGRARSELLSIMYSPEAVSLFSQIKQIFDPANLFNPGILVNPLPVDADVRAHQMRHSKLRIADPSFAADVHRCSGVGKCIANTTANGGVMCPSYQASGLEKDSTRGRAHVLQEMINGQLVDGGWRSPEVLAALDMCLSCKGCHRDCPTGVDMAKFKSHVLDQAYHGRRRPRSHYAMGLLPLWGRIVTKTRLGLIANFFMQTPGFAHLVRFIAGVDQRRPMPRFRSGANAKRITKTPNVDVAPNGDVAVWVDSFTDAFEGDQLPAMLLTLIDAGYNPKVISEDICCGLTWITTGQLSGARKQLSKALDVLTPIAQSGTPIIGMEPSCTAVWNSDAAELLPDDERVAIVSAKVKTLAQLLAATPGWQAPDLAGHKIVIQPHCHEASVIGTKQLRQVLAKTNAQVNIIGGCCGLAGNWGVEQGHYEASVKIFEHDFLPAIKAAGSHVIVITDGFSCHKQLKDLTGMESVTLAQLLARHLN